MKSIQDAVSAKVAEMISGGTLEKTIEEGVEKAITSAINRQFESYGCITKQIGEAITSGLNVSMKDIPFESYNAQMLVAIKARLGNMFAGQAYEHFLSKIDSMLDPAPKELPIDDFLEKIASMWKTDEPWDADDLDDDMTVEITRWEHSSGGEDWDIQLWKKKVAKTYSSGKSCDGDIRLFILKGEIRISRNHQFNPTSFDEVEAYIFKLYAAGTVLTGIEDCDPDNLDLQLKDSEY
jgi:hypothetical protein